MDPDDLHKCQQMCNDFVERIAQERDALEQEVHSEEELKTVREAIKEIQAELRTLFQATRGRLSIGVLDSEEQAWHPSQLRPFWKTDDDDDEDGSGDSDRDGGDGGSGDTADDDRAGNVDAGSSGGDERGRDDTTRGKE